MVAEDAPVPDWIVERFAPEKLDLMRAHPNFQAALWRSVQGGLEVFAADRQTSNALKDMGRFYSGLLCVYLHASGGLTLARLRAHCAVSPFISPAAAESLLAYMRDIDFIEPAAVQPDRRALLLVPAPALMANFVARFRVELEACVLLEPSVQDLLDLWGPPEILEAFFRTHLRDIVDVVQLYDPDTSIPAIFGRNAGPLILFRLLVSGVKGDTMPPRLPVAFSASALAAEFDVSRTHVLRLIQAGEEMGLFERQGSRLLLTPLLEDRLADFFANSYTQVAAAAIETVERLRRGED